MRTPKPLFPPKTRSFFTATKHSAAVAPEPRHVGLREDPVQRDGVCSTRRPGDELLGVGGGGGLGRVEGRRSTERLKGSRGTGRF